MPDIKWEELNIAVHNKRNLLTKVAGVQKILRGVVKNIEADMEMIDSIILRTPDDK